MSEPTPLGRLAALAGLGRPPSSSGPHALSPQDEAPGERGHERVSASQPLPGLGAGTLLPGGVSRGLRGQPSHLHGGRLRGDPQGQAGPGEAQKEGGQAAEKEVSATVPHLPAGGHCPGLPGDSLSKLAQPLGRKHPSFLHCRYSPTETEGGGSRVNSGRGARQTPSTPCTPDKPLLSRWPPRQHAQAGSVP